MACDLLLMFCDRNRKHVMANERLINTFVLAEPFERALALIRKAMENEHLSIRVELDLSGNISKKLGIGVAPCRVLFIECPYLLLQAITLDGSAALFIPVRAVVSDRGPHTLVHFSSPFPIRGTILSAEGIAPVRKLEARFLRALGAIAMRQDLCPSIP